MELWGSQLLFSQTVVTIYNQRPYRWKAGNYESVVRVYCVDFLHQNRCKYTLPKDHLLNVLQLRKKYYNNNNKCVPPSPHKLDSMPLSEIGAFFKETERNTFYTCKYVIESKKVSHIYTPGSYQYNQTFLLVTEQLHWNAWGSIVDGLCQHASLFRLMPNFS